ncbi:non-ribosomal peptide synthetase [Roseateles sp. DB2]|uniref:non-ribosomal peptide synthetase n=1 Tax=Roseateles sp. DB2 TaxID=3453717 RepID=UPI003EE9E524
MFEASPAAGDRVLASFAQQRLWFIDQYESGSGLYNMSVAWRLRGMVDVRALRESLNELLRRHEVLRTVMQADREHDVVQLIAASAEFALVQLDLSAAAQPEEQLCLHLQHEADAPFDLAEGPLIRGLLVRMTPTEHVLLLTMHHIISDGWSIDVLMREMGALYAAFAKGQPSPLPELPIQYADYALWQRQWLQGDVLAAQLDFWRRTLEGAPQLIDLPLDRPRPALLSHRGAFIPFELAGSTSAALRRLCQQTRTTPFMAVSAVLGILLHRYSGQGDVCIGYPVAGRPRKELEGLIGFFVNTLVLRVRSAPGQRFLQVLEQVRESVLDANDHQDLPFEMLVKALQPDRSLNHSPLFQVMLTYGSDVGETPPLPGLELSPQRIGETPTAKFDLTLDLLESGDQLRGAIQYNCDLFDRPTIERMVSHFKTLLAAVVAEPQTLVRDLPLLSGEERRQILVDWNDTQREFPQDRCIHQIFEEQARRTPEAVALVFEGRQLSYAELDDRAERLALQLRSLGVRPDALVGICLERSFEMVVALLAILKAGGAYLPLDPRLPTERLSFMLSDAAPTVMITSRLLQQQLPAFDSTWVCVDDPGTLPPAGTAQHPPITTQAGHLAYCMYTSGSTGRPKAVAIEHRGVLRLVKGTTYARMGAGDTFLLNAPLAFDASTFEIWGALLNGARLVIAPPGLVSVDELRELVRREAVSILWLTAALFDQFCEAELQSLQSLRQLLSGGEVLSVRAVRRLQAALPGCQLSNAYGPTETTTFATCHPFDAGFDQAVAPIGRPITNTQAYILDAQLAPVPVGVTGQIYLAGAGLARCYLNRPDLTAERFVPNPFGAAGSRMYATGDLARYLPDGKIDFVGRIDHQVKIRGFRIELGEIEAALLACPGVKEALVVALADASGGKRLVGYVVAPGLTKQALRDHLQRTLPEYMVPPTLVQLDAFPLNANGKIDRKALPLPAASRDLAEGDYVAPRNASEQRLATLWSEVLKIDRIGVRDNFFALGGHSLLAIRMQGLLASRLGCKFLLKPFFASPTIESLAELLVADAAALPAPQAGSMGGLGAANRRPATANQKTRWRYFRREGWPKANIVLTLRYARKLDAATAREALRTLLDRHEGLRLHFVAVRGQPRLEQRLADTEALLDQALVYDEQALDDEAIQASVRALQDTSFPLHRAPLFKLCVHATRGQSCYLTLLADHGIADGMSMEILWCDLLRALSGEQTQNQPRPPQYFEYAHWVDAALTSAAVRAQRDYWHTLLPDTVPAIPFERERARPRPYMHDTFARQALMDSQISKGLQQLAAKTGVSVFALASGALASVVRDIYESDDILVSSRFTNRPRPEYNSTFGWFLQSWMLRLQSAGKSPLDVARQAFEQLAHVLDMAPILMHPVNELNDPTILGPAYGQRAQIFHIHQNFSDGSASQFIRSHAEPVELTEPAGSSYYDLYLTTSDSTKGFGIHIQFNSSLFKDEEAEDFFKRYQECLVQMAHEGQRPAFAQSAAAIVI